MDRKSNTIDKFRDQDKFTTLQSSPTNDRYLSENEIINIPDNMEGKLIMQANLFF